MTDKLKPCPFSHEQLAEIIEAAIDDAMDIYTHSVHWADIAAKAVISEWYASSNLIPLGDMCKNPRCYDCERPYGEAGFPDLVIPHEHWNAISPTGDEGGLLCPSCLCARLEIQGIKTLGVFASGPLRNPDFKLATTPRKGEPQ